MSELFVEKGLWRGQHGKIQDVERRQSAQQVIGFGATIIFSCCELLDTLGGWFLLCHR